MLVAAFFVLLAYTCFRCLTNDVDGLSLMILVGFLQDPTRKLLAGEPVVMTIMVGVVVACMTIRALLISQQSFFEPFVRWTDTIKAALGVYLVIILLQGLHSLIRYGSPFIPALGAIFYLAPLIAIGLGYFQFGRFELVRKFLLVFCGLALIVALSVAASYLGVNSNLFGEVGTGLLIYDQGTILKAYSGLMRSSEIASWHMGACVCFLIVLIVDRGSVPSLIIVVLAVTLLMSSIILTGRRKMILQILIFSMMYFPLLRYYQGRLSSRFISVSIVGLTLLLSMYWFLPSFEGTQYDLYVARGASVFEDAGQRFSTLGLGSLTWAYKSYGMFGGGLGIAAQGSQHFGQSGSVAVGEGGIGKLVSELGLISLFIVAWLGLMFAKHLHRCIGLVAQATPTKLPFTVGILVFLLANVPTFIVASQVYGDVFVLLILGFLAGSLFALPKQVTARLNNIS